jgi:hypothetical protein
MVDLVSHTGIDYYAIRAAESKTVESQLPGRENGPADACRRRGRRTGIHSQAAILLKHKVVVSGQKNPPSTPIIPILPLSPTPI